MALQLIIGDFTDSTLAESLIVRTQTLKENGIAYCGFVYLFIIFKKSCCFANGVQLHRYGTLFKGCIFFTKAE